MAHHLSKSASIVTSPDFENGIVKCIDGKYSELLFAEKIALKSLEKQVCEQPSGGECSFVEKILLAKKKKLELCGYLTMSWIPGTSNVCDRIFSRAKLNVGYLRHNMSPMHLEAELFLFVNKKFWDAKTVSQLASNHVDL